MTELFNDNLHSSLISTKVASEVSGYNPDYITRLCREKKIKGTQVGKVWLVERESLDAFVTAQGIMKHVRAEKLRTARAKEYRKAKRPVLTAALAAKTIEKTARRTTRAVRQNVFSAPTYSPRLVALAVALIVVAGSAYASTDQRALVFISAIPDATMRLTFASGPHLEPASSFRATSQTQPTHVAVMAPSIPNARTASRGFSLFASNSVIAALASANDLMDEARVPFNQTDLAHTARTRINRASIIAHDPLGSAIAVYVGTGELAYDASFSISNAYLSSVQHAGNSALASAAHARDGIAVLPRISGSIVDTYTRGVYAFTDASPKLADTSVLALYDLGDVISSKTASLSALPVAKQQEVAYNAAATVRSISARPQTADLAIAPSSVQASVASAAPASGMQLPLAHAYAAATNAEGALIALPLKAEDTMLGIAGYASTFIDAKQQPSDMLASAASPSWFTPITDMLDRTGRFTHALFASAVRALALLFPGGNIAAPALTVLSTEPAQTIAMPVPAPTITVSNTVSNATGGAYVDKRTVIQNFITSYPGSFSPTSFVGSAFDDAVMAVTRPFVQESVDRAIRSVHPGVDSNGATLTNVTINGGNATLSLLTAASTTLATTTITADLNVRGAVTAGTLNVGSLSSFGGIVAPYLNATDTNATSTFTNLTADTAALASANVNTLTLGSTSLTSFLGLGLSNIGGALTVATSSFSGPGSLFNADLLDGLDSTYILANAFSTSSADVWITSKSTDALPEGTSNLYYTDARARNAISATGVLTYASSTGVFSIAQSNGTTDGYLSAIDWTSFNNKISSTSLSALYPLTYNSSSGIFGLAFGTSTSNTWGGTQIFTNAPVLGSLTGFIKASAGALTTSLIDLSTDVSSTLPVSHGGTGSTSLTGLLKGNGTGPLLTATPGVDYAPATSGGSILYGNGAGGFSSVSISSPLTFTSGALGIQQANGSQNGYLTSSDWTTFNNKQVALTGTTGQFPYFSGTNTVTATSSIFLATNGNVGIGTTSPSATLSITGNSLLGGNLIVTGTATIGTLNGLVKGTNGVLSAAIDGTDYLSPATIGASFYTYFHATTTDALAEGTSHLYYTDARARNAISSSASGLSYNNLTGALSLTNGYVIPLSASTTEWSSFYATPSTRITAGTNLSWAGNTLNGPTDSYIHALFSAASPIAYNSSTGAFSISTSTLYTGTAGQVAYFNGTNTLTGTSNIFISGSNIGIGTITPVEKLQVSGAVQIDGRSATTTNKNERQVLLTQGGNELLVQQTSYWNGSSYTPTTGYGFGYQALLNNSSVNDNGFGYQALANNRGAYSNGFGYQALLNNTGFAATGFGNNTLYNNTGDNSSGLGYNALFGNTGSNATGVGYQALDINHGSFANGFGSNALYNNTGSFSNGFGYQALYNNTGVSANGFGDNALYNNSGSNAAGFGSQALYNNTGAYASGFGYQTLYKNQGDYAVAMGYQAGFNGTYPITGNYNTFLGSNSTYDTTNGTSTITNATAVGANIKLTTSNTVILGNAANVGIGTTSPFAKLSVAGNAYVGGALTATGTISFTGLGTGLVKSTAGTLTNATDGTDYLSPTAFDARLTATTSLSHLTTLAGLSTVGTITSGTWHGGVIGQAYGGTGLSSYSPGDILYADNTGTLMQLPHGASGQVLKVQAGLPAWGVDETIGSSGNDGIFATSTGLIYPLDTSNTLLVGTNATSTSNSILEVNGQAYISSKLGIGTSSPSAQLSVTGSGYFSGTLTASSIVDMGLSTNALVYVNGSNQLATTTISGPLSFSSGTLSISQANTSTSGYLSSTDWTTFNAKQDALTFAYPLINTGNTISTAFATSSATLGLGLSGALTTLGSSDSLTIATSSLFSGTTGQFPYFSGTNTLTATSSIFLDTTGNVGIGTTSPSQLLSVAGNAYIRGGLGVGEANAVANSIDVSQYGSYMQAGKVILYASTTNGSTQVGVNAGFSLLAAGLNNTAIGYQALFTATSSDYNTAIGYQALYNNTGNSNVANGYRALFYNTTGADNTALGFQALYMNSTGNYNTGIGYGALNANTTGTENVALGFDAMESNLTGNANVALGWEAMFHSTSTSNNIAIGFQALSGNTGGNNNVAIGLDTLLNNVTGGNNTAIGFQSLFNNTTGSNNTAIGYQALFFNATATSNTGIGFGAGSGSSAFSNQGGTYVGYQAGTSVSTGSDYNTLVGYNSGFGVTTGARNVLIGQSTIAASYNQVTTGSNNIAIGNDVAVPSATASNQLVIGNLIYGTGLDGTGATVSTGNIGIGTTSPSQTLSVAGNAYITGTATIGTLNGLVKGTNGVLSVATAGTDYQTPLVAGTDYAPATSGTALLYGNGAGGFSNASVSSPLTFTGGTLGIQAANTSQPGYLTSTDWNTFNGKQDALSFSYPLVNSANTISLAFGTTTANSWSQLQTLNGGFISQASSTATGAFNVGGTAYFGGNVGIGTTSPMSALALNGNFTFAAGSDRTITVAPSPIAGNALTISAGNNNATGNYPGGNLNLNSGNGTGAGVGGSVIITAGNTTGNAHPGDITLLAGSGGTGSNTGGNITLNGGTSTGGNGNILLATLRGNVGIGTTSPYATLSVASTTTSGPLATFEAPVAKLRIYATAGNGAQISFGDNGAYDTAFVGTAPANGLITGASAGDLNLGAYNKNIVFSTANGGGSAQAIITSAGNFGIGTTSPQSRLHIEGTNSVSGGLSIYSTVGTANGRLAIYPIGNTSTAIQKLSSNGVLNFLNSGGANELSIDNVGNVTVPLGKFGIGTSSADTQLVVNSSAGASNRTWAPTTATVAVFDRGGLGSYIDLVTGVSGLDRINFGNTNTEIKGMVQYDNSVDALSLWTATAQRLTINSSGNVGIGTTTPNTLLDVNGRGRFLSSTQSIPTYGKGIEIQYDGTNNFGTINAYDRSASAYQILRIDGSSLLLNSVSVGNVGIGTTSPSQTLSVAGNAYITGTATIGTLNGLVKGTNGVLSVATAGTDYQTPLVAGTDYAPATSGTALLYGNGAGGFSNASVSSPLTFTGGTLGIQAANASQPGYLTSSDWTTFNNKQVALTGTTGQFPYFSGTNTVTATSSIFLATNGNVGIGTTVPNGKLAVFSTLTDTAASAVFGANVTNTIAPTATSATEFRSLNMSNTITSSQQLSTLDAGYFENRLTGTGSISTANGLISNGLVLPAAAQNFGTVNEAVSVMAYPVNSFSNTVTGNVITARGLRVANSSNTGYTLTNQVGVSIDPLTTGTNNTALLIGGSGVPTGNYGIYNQSPNNNYFAGNVGIGTTSPYARLTTAVSAAATTTIAEFSNSTLSGSGNPIEIKLGNSTGLGASGGYASIQAGRFTTNDRGLRLIGRGQNESSAPTSIYLNGNGGTIAFNTNVSGSDGIERVRIDNSGNFGIGTTSPSQLLSVAGNAYITGTATIGTLNGLIKGTNGVLSAAAAGTDYAPATTGTALLYGNGAGGFSNASVSSPLTFTGGTLGIQAANTSQPGYLTSTDWNTFNGKQDALSFSYPLVNSANTISLAFGTTTANSWSQLQTFTNGFVSQASSTILGDLNITGIYNINSVPVAYLPDQTAFGGTVIYGNGGGYLSHVTGSDGQGNTGVGINAFHFLSTGSFNTAIGNAALYNTTVGTDNVANGVAALYSNTSGIQNTAIGNYSLFSNTTGGNNSAFGYQAGEYIANGTTGNTTSSNSLYLGFGTKALANGDTNEIVLGYNAVGLGSNSAVLGNDSITKTILKGNVGINTTVPGTNLSVVQSTAGVAGLTIATPASAAGYASGASLQFNYSGATAQTTRIARIVGVTEPSGGGDLFFDNAASAAGAWNTNMVILRGGNVGIGTTSPSQLLSVAGNAYITGTATIGTLNGLIKGTNGVLSAAAAGTDYAPATSGTALLYGNGAGGFSNASVSSPLTFTGGTLGIQAANASQPGYLTSTDWNTFNGKQDALSFSYPLVNSANTISLAFGTTTANSWSQTQTFTKAGTTLGAATVFQAGSNVIAAQFGSGSTAGFTADQYGSAVRFNGLGVQWGDLSYYPTGGGNGNQGNFRLSVAGGVLNTTPNAKLGVGDLYVNGNVGIGTTTPSALLTVSGSQAGISIDRTGNDSYLQLSSSGVVAGQLRYFAPNVLSIADLNGTDKVVFDTSLGYVGIGTTSPQTLLGLQGGIGVSSSQLYLGANGNTALGANSVSSSARLSITPSGTDALFINNSSGALRTDFGFDGGGNYQERMRNAAGVITTNITTNAGTPTYFNAGNVGIGTTSPLGKLHIATSGSGAAAVSSAGDELVLESGGTTGATILGGTASDLGLYFGDSVSQTMGRIVYANSTDSLQLWTNATQRLTINSSGNVGIGTTTPDAELTVVTAGPSARTWLAGAGTVAIFDRVGTGSSGAAYLDLVTGTTGVDAIRFGNTTNEANGELEYNYATNAMNFYTNGSARATIDASGNLAIGTTSPLTRLDVVGTNGLPINTGLTSAALLVRDSTTNYRLGLGTYSSGAYIQSANTGTAYGSLSLNPNGGNVGIGTTTPSNTLSISTKSTGNGITFDSNGTIIGSLAQNTVGQAVGLALEGVPGRQITINGTSNSNVLIANGGGNVGIGTTTPQSRLHIEGTNSVSGGLSIYSTAGTANGRLAIYPIGNTSTAIQKLSSNGVLSFLNSAGGSELTIDNAGNVGIGTTSPAAQLSLSKSTGGDRMFEMYDTFSSPTTYDALLYRANNIPAGTGATTANALLRLVDSSSNYPLSIETTAGASLLDVMGNGNVGIGTSTPSAKLMVMGNGTNPAVRIDGSAGTALQLDYFSHGGSFYSSYYATLGQYGGAGGVGTIGGLQIVNQSPVLNSSQDIVFANQLGTSAAIARMIIDGYGNVGIGAATSSITARLTVQGADTSAATHALEVTNSASTTLFMVNDAGNVGIGTTSPSAPLSVSGNAYITGTTTMDSQLVLPVGTQTSLSLAFEGNQTTGIFGNGTGLSVVRSGSLMAQFGPSNVWFNNAVTSLASASGFNINSTSGTNAPVYTFRNDTTTGVGHGANANELAFFTNNINRVLINAAGNVGIGTTSPGSTLSVAGNSYVSGFYNTSGTTGGYQIDGNTVLQASSSNFSTFLGVNAGASVQSSASSNTALGSGALFSNQTGSYNTASGQGALSSNVSGSFNVANGSGALFYTTTSNNVAVGYNTLGTNTTGAASTGVGESALYYNTSANSSVAVGSKAAMGTASYSNQGITALGYQAGASLQTGSDYNTLVGYNSGFGVTTGARNVLIGQSTIAASYNQVTTGSNNIAIGNDVAVPSATASNQLVIGNLIYGTGLDGTGATVSTGNIGVGTTTPWRTLAVSGTAAINGLTSTGGTLTLCINNTTKEIVTSSAACTTSDERLKTNIQSLDGSAGLEAIEALHPVSFDYKDSSFGTGPQLGFLAQEVAKIFPEFVSTSTPTAYTPDVTYTLNYQGLITPTIKALQELAQGYSLSNPGVASSTIASSYAGSGSAAITVDSQGNVTMGKALTASSITAGTLSIAQSFSAGAVTAQSVTAGGTVSANRYVVPQQASVFAFGSSTVSMQVPPEALASGGSVDLYQLAGYATAGVEALAARTDLLSVKIDDLATRVSALEALHAATTTASTTDTQSSSGFLATLENALSGLGIIIHQGYLALDSLVTHQLFLVKGSDGTSSTGSEVIPSGATHLTVMNPLVHTSSQIFLTFTSSVDGSWYLSQKQEGSFTITLSKAQAQDTEFDYFIIQTDPNAQMAAAGQAAQPAGATEAPSTPAPVSVNGGPMVTLNGDPAVQLPQGAAWTDPGATAKAADGTDLTSSITVAGSVDTNTAGLYTITYNVVDAAGLGGQASRVVTVLAPTSAPSDGTTVTQAPASTSSTDTGTTGTSAASTDSSASSGTTATASTNTTSAPAPTASTDTTSAPADSTASSGTVSAAPATSPTPAS